MYVIFVTVQHINRTAHGIEQQQKTSKIYCQSWCCFGSELNRRRIIVTQFYAYGGDYGRYTNTENAKIYLRGLMKITLFLTLNNSWQPYRHIHTYGGKVRIQLYDVLDLMKLDIFVGLFFVIRFPLYPFECILWMFKHKNTPILVYLLRSNQ